VSRLSIKTICILRRLIRLSRFYIRNGKSNLSFCSVCGQKAKFIITGKLWREHYICSFCAASPRQRSLMTVFNIVAPHWRELTIHESSPYGASSKVFEDQCQNYIATHLFKDIPLGSYLDGIRCENIEKMTFHDQCFDVVITQDVMEHVLNPQKAFAEIARILKPGGIHIFTVPFYDGKKSVIRSVDKDGKISYLHTPRYHGNPIDKQGSLVTVDWGYDIIDFIYSTSGMKTTIYSLLDRSLLSRFKILDVFVSKKNVL